MRIIDTDVAIIGTGTAGLGAYRAAKQHTDNVVLIEGGAYGTTCARVGCMPSKLLIAAAEAAHSIEKAHHFGVNPTGYSIDGKAVMQRVKSERDRFVGFVLESVESINADDRILGFAKFIDDNTLMVDDHTKISAKRIVIATGSRPTYPPFFEQLGDRLIINDDVFEWDDLPESVIVFGPGVIGLELGQALHRLGVKVHMFGVGGAVGPITDPVVADYAKTLFANEFYLDPDAKIEKLEKQGDKAVVTFIHKDTGELTTVSADFAIAATGRKPNVDNLDIGNTNLELDDRGVPLANPYTMQCGQSNIFIAGDASNMIPLLHEATDQGKIAGDNAGRFPDIRPGLRRAGIGVVFSDPQLATVGSNFRSVEGELGDCGCYAVGEVSFEGQGRSRVMLKNKGVLRVYGEQGTGTFIGAEMIGPGAEHIAHLLSWAVQNKMTVSQMLDMPFYHPVIEEGVRTALRDLNAKLHIGQAIIDQCAECGPGA